MKQIAFTISIYPSMSSRGFAVSIHTKEASLVLGTVKDPELVKAAFDDILAEGSEWQHDESMNVYTMEVRHPLTTDGSNA